MIRDGSPGEHPVWHSNTESAIPGVDAPQLSTETAAR
jgi:hypothetical protein